MMHTYSERFADLSLYQSGTEQTTPGQSLGPLAYDYYMFVFLTSGRGVLSADDPAGGTRRFQIGPEQGYLLRPGQPSMFVSDVDDPARRIWLGFAGVSVADMLQRTTLTKEDPVYSSKDKVRRRLLADEMLAIAEHPDLSMLRAIGHLYAFAGYLLESTPSAQEKRSAGIRDRYVRTALNFIEENYNKKIRVEDIAAKCGIDRSYFSKLFHQALGISPQRFLLEYRMTHACTLLQETELTISSVGEAVGYDNAMHFSRTFRALYGVSPRHWREQNRRAVR